MNWLMLILMTLLQATAGLGLVSFFNIRLKPAMMLCLWLLSGVAVFSFIPFLLQLFYIPLTEVNIFLALIIAALLLNIRYRNSIQQLKRTMGERSFKIELYEIPFLLVITVIVLISVWRCYYLPPTPRDLTSGAEVIAEYAVKEKTMINSVFSVNLESTNNQFKPPFITSLQIIYKYAGFYFGQIWLSTIFICFIVFLYHALSNILHKLLAGFLLVAFLAIPEMYAYTFMALFDYSNAVFFFLACYFLFEYLKTREANLVKFAGLLMGIATYIRSETLILAGFIAVVLLLRKRFISILWFLLPAVCLYILSVTIYINYYLPSLYDIGGLMNTDFFNLKPLLKRFNDMNYELIFGKLGITYFGYFFFFFLLILLMDLIWTRKLNAVTRNWLFAVLVIYLGLPVLGFLFPLMDIDNTTKRGLFKIFPLMLLFMASSTPFLWLSKRIS